MIDDWPDRPLQPPPTKADGVPWCLMRKRYEPQPMPSNEELADRLEKLRARQKAAKLAAEDRRK